MKKQGLILLLISITLCLYSQPELDFIDPLSLYEQGKELYRSGNNEEALVQLRRINENDSIFLTSVFLQAEILLDEKKYPEVIEMCNKYSSRNRPFYFDLKLYKGLSLLRQDKYEEAIKSFKRLQAEYPKNYLVAHNLGIAYEQVKKLDEAIQSYQASIIYNPYYAESHLALGNLCYKENKIGQALLCWDSFLMIRPTSEKSTAVLIMANRAVSTQPEHEPKGISFSKDDELFKHIDAMLISRVALDEKYEIPIKLDAAFVKQNYALKELIKDYEGTNGFWSEKYIPMFKRLIQSNNFENFLYRTLSSVNNKKYQKIILKSTRNSEEFVNWYTTEWVNIIGSNNEASDKDIQYTYRDDGTLSAVGKKDETGELHGSYVFYDAGRVMSTGRLKNGSRIGHWQWLYASGELMEEIDYDANGKANGIFTKYHRNGAVKSTVKLVEGAYHGEYRQYNKLGYLEEISNYKEDTYNGIMTLYHPLGEKHLRIKIPYSEGVIEGEVVKYFPGGKPEMRVEFKNDMRTGEEVQYFPNGKKSSVYSYADGKLKGLFKNYYFAGALQSEGNYSEGKPSGKWINYYVTGGKKQVSHYKEGEMHGDYLEYNPKGVLIAHFTYENGQRTSFRYFNNSGRVISQKEGIKGKYEFKWHRPNGNLLSEGNYNDKGEKAGEWKYFSEYGALDSKEFYTNGELEGPDSTFYANGAVLSCVPYKKDKAHGLFTSYYIDGTLKEEGYYKDDQAERVWRNYYPDGTLASENYFRKNNQDGFQYDYSNNGKLHSKDYMENGLAIYTIYYDTAGGVADTTHYFADSIGTDYYAKGQKKFQYKRVNGFSHGKQLWYYPDGKLSCEGNYFMGEEEDPWIWYHDNGKRSSVGTYKNGKRDGLWTTYYKNGLVNQTLNYSNGKLNGEYKTFSDIGKLEFETTYSYNSRDNESRHYSPEGELQMVRYYDQDELIGYTYLNSDGKLKEMIPIKSGTGKITSYFQNGKKAREFELLAGQFNAYYSSYYSNGQIESKSYQQSGEKVGESIDYYKNGQIKRQMNYLNDELHGKYDSFYENGTPKAKLIYKNGVPVGKGEYYKEDGRLNKEEWYFNGEVYEAKYY